MSAVQVEAHPTLLSTKGILVAQPEYLSLLSAPNFAVQISLTTLDDTLAQRIDAGAPTTSARLDALKRLAEGGVKTAIRHQPMMPTRAQESVELVDRAAAAGAKHYAVEHLKLSEYVNSRSRQANESLDSYIAARWNGVSNGPSPTSFFGVEDTGKRDAAGMKIYALSDAVLAISAGTTFATPSHRGGFKVAATSTV